EGGLTACKPEVDPAGELPAAPAVERRKEARVRLAAARRAGELEPPLVPVGEAGRVQLRDLACERQSRRQQHGHGRVASKERDLLSEGVKDVDAAGRRRQCGNRGARSEESREDERR